MSADNEPGAKPDDVLFVHSPSEQGEGFRVVRKREGAIEVGELRAIREGKPIHGEVVKLTPRPEHAQLFDVDVLVPGPSREAALESGGRPGKAAGAGPAQVAGEAYRANWDAIFGPERSEREPTN